MSVSPHVSALKAIFPIAESSLVRLGATDRVDAGGRMTGNTDLLPGYSKDELRSHLCDDPLVVDLMQVAPEVVRDGIRAAGGRAIHPYWRSPLPRSRA